MKHSCKGFTLIELMITVAVLGILVAIAYPSYTGYIVDARRSDAQQALLGFANAMERYKSQNMAYTGAATSGNNTGTPAASLYVSQAPISSGDKYYNLTITAAASASYTLRATAIAGTSQASDGYLEITSTGIRRWDQNNNGAIGAGETTWEE